MEAVLEKNEVAGRVEKALTLFVEAVDLSTDLEVIGTAFPESKADEVFVVRDHSKSDGIEGAYVEVSLDEVVRKVTDCDKAQEFVDVIQNDRGAIVLEGVTRIVGYYSRVNNWNKSKIGELRDRTPRNYGLTGDASKYDAERMSVIDSM